MELHQSVVPPRRNETQIWEACLLSMSSRPQFSRSGQIRWTRKNGASRFSILHTFNIENQNNIVAQNENILKHSSSSSCKDLDK